ncbi:MAG: Gfo/Idh/MocA family oxidoreductase [Isosphaeraceae bacterium]
MVESSQVRLRVGVIGLGRLWEARHKPALARLRDRFQVTGVYDQVYRRAEMEAAHLKCAAVEGLSTLVNRPDVDVIHVLTPQWFGLYPIRLACQARKPVYCALSLADEGEDLEELAREVDSSGIPFMVEFARRFYPATLRLRELLETTLGKPRLILGHSRLFGFDRYGSPGPATQTTLSPSMIDPGSYLLDWCCFLFQSSPTALQGNRGWILPEHQGEPSSQGPGADFDSFLAEFPGGGIAQISFGRYHRSVWGEATKFLPSPGFQVYAERGAAWVELPDRVQWSDAGGTHEERLALEPTVGEVLNDQFYRLVRGDPSLAPAMNDALAVARRVADIRRSQVEGCKIQQNGERSGAPTPPRNLS